MKSRWANRRRWAVCWMIVWGSATVVLHAAIWIPSFMPTYKEAASLPTPLRTVQPEDFRPRSPQAWMLRESPRPVPFAPPVPLDSLRPTFHREPIRETWMGLRSPGPERTPIPLHDLALRVSVASRPATLTLAGRRGPLPEPPTFRPPQSAIEYLLADEGLTEPQRRRIEAIVARFEERDRAYRNALRADLDRLERFVAGELTDSEARRVLKALQTRREAELRLLEETLRELDAVLTASQWERFTAWIRRRPWMPFHRPLDTARR